MPTEKALKLTHVESLLTPNLSRTTVTNLIRAIRLAQLGTETQRHSAVVTQASKVIAVGVNTFRNDPLNSNVKPNQLSYHAEYNALKQLDPAQLQNNLKAYVVRINRRGQLLPSRPCRECLTSLSAWKIKEVFHS